MPSSLVDLQTMADQLQIHPETLRRYYRKGRVRGYKLGHNVLRFDPREVREDLRVKKTGAP